MLLMTWDYQTWHAVVSSLHKNKYNPRQHTRILYSITSNGYKRWMRPNYISSRWVLDTPLIDRLYTSSRCIYIQVAAADSGGVCALLLWVHFAPTFLTLMNPYNSIHHIHNIITFSCDRHWYLLLLGDQRHMPSRTSCRFETPVGHRGFGSSAV